MVVRQPVEKWSRPELEDHFHDAFEQLQKYKKKVNEQEKTLTQLNTKFRQTLLNRKTKDEETVERQKYDEIYKENQLLSMKLKSAKHQLLTYTTPSARITTASAMTGRSTYRPQSSIRRIPQTANTESGRFESIETKEISSSRTVRINDAALAEKANIIRLNREVRDKNLIIAQKQFELERMTDQLQELRNQLERRSAQLDSVRTIHEERTDTTGLQPSTVTNQLLMIEKELSICRTENVVLKEANERLVKQSLSNDFDNGAVQQIELKKEIAVLEEKLKESERREKDMDKRRRQDRQTFDEWKEKNKQQQQQSKVAAAENRPTTQPPIIERVPSPVVNYEEKYRRKSRKKDDDDVLMKLYKDVSGILEGHDSLSGDVIMDGNMTNTEKLNKWQRMYSELYDEMEKVRNMLLIQHNINQKQGNEIVLLQDELDRSKILFESKMIEMRDEVKEKQKKVILLEEQIRCIAYSGQKSISIKHNEKDLLSTTPTDLSIKLTHIELSADCVRQYGPSPPFFLSLEFFDFELQTTPIIQKAMTTLDYTSIYNIVVSSLFVHYIESNGITIEMYRPIGVSYELMAAGVISLRQFINNKKKMNRMDGEIKIIGMTDGKILATLKYQIEMASLLAESIKSHQKIEAAQKLIPVEIPIENDNFDELVVLVNRVTGLENVSQKAVETCVVYELCSFSPFFTDSVISSGIAEYSSSKTWNLPSHDEFHSYLSATEITFFLVDSHSSEEGKGGVEAILSLPLAPLIANKSIKGSFPMTKSDGTDSGVFLDIAIMWKYGISAPTKEAITEKQNVEEVSDKPVPSRVIISSSSVLNPIVSSPSSSESESPQRRPIVSDIQEYHHQQFDEDEVESISSKSEGGGVVELNSDRTDQFALESSIVAPKSPPKTPSPPSRQTSPPTHTQTNDELDGEYMRADSPVDSIKSDTSHGTYTKEEDIGDVDEIISTNTKDSGESDSLPVQESNVDKDQIRKLLADLPPIAKPRMIKAPSAYQPSSLSFLEKYDRQPSESDEEQKEEIREKEEEDEEKRKVFFTDPLHHSIPPSDTSSIASPPRYERPPVRLPDYGGRSSIKAAMAAARTDSDVDENCFATIRVLGFSLPEFSRLLVRNYDKTMVYVDWSFLDFPNTECRTQSIELPRIALGSVNFEFKKDYYLSRRRISLLEQWIELSNRVEFTLLTEGSDSEELCVAQLELNRYPAGNNVGLTLSDVSGEHLANLRVQINYSPALADALRQLR